MSVCQNPKGEVSSYTHCVKMCSSDLESSWWGNFGNCDQQKSAKDGDVVQTEALAEPVQHEQLSCCPCVTCHGMLQRHAGSSRTALL
jgi:hypothetical protein